MKIPNPHEHYPPSWSDFDSRAAVAFRVFKSAADVNRFGARYRLAKAFRGITLEGYNEATASGYSALTRLVFAWSALEGMLTAIGKNNHHIAEMSKSYSYQGMLADLRLADPEKRFYKFVYPRLDNKNQQAEVKKFIDELPCCGLTLVRAARHIFVHGPLTPSANQAEPAAVRAVCERLTVCLFRVMDREFKDRVAKLVILAPSEKIADLDDHPF